MVLGSYQFSSQHACKCIATQRDISLLFHFYSTLQLDTIFSSGFCDYFPARSYAPCCCQWFFLNASWFLGNLFKYSTAHKAVCSFLLQNFPSVKVKWRLFFIRRALLFSHEFCFVVEANASSEGNYRILMSRPQWDFPVLASVPLALFLVLTVG